MTSTKDVFNRTLINLESSHHFRVHVQHIQHGDDWVVPSKLKLTHVHEGNVFSSLVEGHVGHLTE